jgi:hypothetical protein
MNKSAAFNSVVRYVGFSLVVWYVGEPYRRVEDAVLWLCRDTNAPVPSSDKLIFVVVSPAGIDKCMMLRDFRFCTGCLVIFFAVVIQDLDTS